MNFKGKGRRNKGITLIALVITIIVLLILAGVTINTLFDNGNAIDKAAEARDETNKGNIKEQLQLAVITSRINDNNANINTDKLKSELEKLKDTGIIDKYEPEENFELPCTVTKDNYEFTIDKDGNVTAKSENAKKAEKVNKAIGQTVNYTDQENNENSKGWRIFYASEDEMFLITADDIDSKIAFEGTKGIPLAPKEKYSEPDDPDSDNYNYSNESDKYKGSEDVFSAKNSEEGTSCTYKNVKYGEKYNSKWKTQLGETTNTNDNSKATAYLCDPQNWEKYISTSAPDGTYAVGGPTNELLVLSWNQAKESGLDTAPTRTVTWEDSDVIAAGYLYNKPEGLKKGNPIKKDILKGLYNTLNTSTNYWLASPCSASPYTMCFVSDSNYISGMNYKNKLRVRPIVSIPISNVQIGTDGTVQIVP